MSKVWFVIDMNSVIGQSPFSFWDKQCSYLEEISDDFEVIISLFVYFQCTRCQKESKMVFNPLLNTKLNGRYLIPIQGKVKRNA